MGQYTVVLKSENIRNMGSLTTHSSQIKEIVALSPSSVLKY